MEPGESYKIFTWEYVTPGHSIPLQNHNNQGAHPALEKLILLRDSLSICGWTGRASKCDRKDVRKESSITGLIIVTWKK